MISIGERLYNLRKSHNFTMQYIAERIGKGKSNISDYEKGKYEPSAQVIPLLAEVLQVTSDFLITGKESSFQVMNSEHTFSNILSDDESDLIRMYSALDNNDKDDVFQLARIKYERAFKKGYTCSTYTDANGKQESDTDSGDNTTNGIA